MGAGPWQLYNIRRYLMDGTIDVDDDSFAMSLFTGASNASDLTKQVIGDLTNEVATAHGYTQGGQALQNVVWEPDDIYPDKMKWSADPAEWIATGGDIVNVQYAVIWRNSGTPATNYLMLVAALDESGQFTTTNGNKLTVTPNTQGIFEFR